MYVIFSKSWTENFFDSTISVPFIKSGGNSLDKTSDPDARLVKQACAGDRDAFASLLERHYDRLHRIIWRVVGSREDAEDIVQDVCCALVSKIDTFRGEAKVSTWLAGIAINAARDFLRRRKSRHATQEKYAAVVSLHPQPDGRDLDQKRWLESVLGQLTENLRETVILVAGEGLSHAEAAQALNIKENTVSWRMHEVRKFLREEGIEEMLHG